MNAKNGPLTVWLERSPQWVFVLYAIIASFSTYFCMYAFRKPFSAGYYEDMTFFGLELKTALVISQILGYTLSKYIGIKICSEVTWAQRARYLVFLIVAAQASLVLFAVVPGEYKAAAIFLNGLPLGMVWGMVVGYLEGRRTSELLLAGLSCSFIISSGVVKDAGIALMNAGVPEFWMPAATGLVFLLPFFIAVWLLDQIPRPSEADIAARVEREPMDGGRRIAFVRHFLPGLAMLFVAYFFITAYRDFRDNYGVEIFRALGYMDEPAIFTRTELPVAFGVMAALAALNLIRNNKLGLIGAYAIMAGGMALIGAATLMMDMELISGAWWMVLVGLGAYLAYVPYGSVLFDRTIASTRVAGTAVFAIYVADALGYTGSVGVQLYKDLADPNMSRFEFFRQFTYFMSILGTVLLSAACVYFLTAHEHHEEPAADGAPVPAEQTA